MPRQNHDDFILLTGRANPELSHAIGKILGVEVLEPISIFSDGEIRVRISKNLRRRMVFIIQPTATPVNDHIMELLFMIDAAKRASASEITAILPYYGYGRQDRKEMSRVPISSSVVASSIANAGADRIFTIDIHSEQQEGFVKKPWDNIYGSYSLLPAIKKKNLSNVVVAAPDKGGMLQATGYAKLLGVDEIALVYKKRDIMLNNVSNTLAMIGNVKDKDVLLVDDMIDTAGTIVNAANHIHKKGAKSVRVVATHGIFSGDALQKINSSAISEVITTDTISHRPEIRNSKKMTIVSVAPLIAEAIKRIKSGESISKDLIL
ncbi:MAG TPA: ribose-phosphate diphosphokinase [Methylomirabilota bacterium]|nr:ribose-phosphate diphosphokinase [Methylomirabilota bacterium]